MTGHQQLLTGLIVSDKWLNFLPEEYQEILKEESYNAGKFASETILKETPIYYKQLQEKGMQVTDVDKEAFIKATEHTYDVLNFREIKDDIDKELGRD